MALVTPWVALISGERPRIKTAWAGDRYALSGDWSGGAFVLNLLEGQSLGMVTPLVNSGVICLDIEQDLDQNPLQGHKVAAPRIPACAVQIECDNGHVTRGLFSADLTGDVVIVHRHHESFTPRELLTGVGRYPLAAT